MSADEVLPLRTPDFRFYPLKPGIERATLEARWMRLRWTDGAEARFHHVWLRDNAADAASIDAHSRERLFDILDIPSALSPAGVGIDTRGALVIDWGDRESVYHPGWLRAYAYDLGASDARTAAYETWDAGMSARLPTFDAGEISASAAVRLAWLEAIRRDGIALVTASPVDPGEYIEWLESLLLIRDMNWGKHFDVVYQADGKYIPTRRSTFRRTTTPRRGRRCRVFRFFTASKTRSRAENPAGSTASRWPNCCGASRRAISNF